MENNQSPSVLNMANIECIVFVRADRRPCQHVSAVSDALTIRVHVDEGDSSIRFTQHYEDARHDAAAECINHNTHLYPSPGVSVWPFF